MKAKNTIFFGEKGISSTSANHLANIAKENAEKIQRDLKAVVFINTDVCLINSDRKSINLGRDKTFLISIPGKLSLISEFNSFCAWMREAIKAREEEVDYLDKLDLKEYCLLSNKEFPISPKLGIIMTSDDALATLSIAERIQYYSLEAEASTIGKYIHPGQEFSSARNNVLDRIYKPKSVSGSGADLLIYEYSPSCNIDDIEKMFFDLQASHRAAESHLNSLKFKIKNIQDENKLAESRKYAETLRSYTDRCSELIAEMNIFVEEEKKKLLSLKIIIPYHLQKTYDLINKNI